MVIMSSLVFKVFLWITPGTFPDPLLKPNVLLILTDDQGYGDLSLHGNKEISTPVLDKLARESVQFSRFYVSPLCAPTRASILTGRYHLRTGTVSVSKGMEIMKSSEKTMAEVFKENGYRTGIFGKWHNGQHMPNHPNGQGFDDFVGFCGGHLSNYFDTELERNGRKIKTNGYVSDVLTDNALTFIEKNRDNSFFCFVSYNTPHSPHQVADFYFDKYKAKGLNHELASVYGMVENIDDNIGRLLTKLKDSGLAERTIVIFLSDNGPNGVRFNGAMKGIKGSVDEGGVRVPSFWRWTGKIKPTVVVEPAAHIDILPTLIELCGLQTDANSFDGVSLSSRLQGDASNINRILFTHVAQPQLPIRSYPGAARDNRYRLVVHENYSQLYDIIVDPSQKNDISKQNPETTEQLLHEYQKWFNEVSKELDPIPLIPLSPLRDVIELPTYEASSTGNLRFKEGHGWVHDWLVNWTSEEDSISWEVESLKDQSFTFYLNYTCPADKLGSEVKITIGNNSVVQKIVEAYDPEFISSPDRVVRKEVYEKTWRRMEMGTLSIPKGESRIVITAPKVLKGEVVEIKSIELVRKL